MIVRKPTTILTATAATLLAVLALAIPANATRVKAACAYGGEAKVIDKEDPSVGVRLTGGKGEYAFHSLAVFCVGVKDGVPEVQSVDTRAEGVYQNLICGTGKVVGTIMELDGPLKYQNLLIGKKFTMHFMDRTAIFFWHDTDKPFILDFKENFLDEMTAPTDEKSASVKNWQAAGVGRVEPPTSKVPEEPDPKRNHCMKAFTVYGFVVIDEDDGNGPVSKFP